MTMLNETTPELSEAEQEHLRLLDVSHSARAIARSALRVAHSDVEGAFHQLGKIDGTVDEALQIIAEAREQLEFAAAFLRGKVWTLRL